MGLLDNMRIVAKVGLTFAALLVVSLLISLVSWRSLNHQEEASDMTVHTYIVLQKMDAIIGAMVDQETGIRAYLLSGGDEKFLDPQKAGMQHYADAYAAVRQLTADNAVQQKRLAELDATVKDWQTKVVAQEIALTRNPATVEQGRALEVSGAGKQYMDGVRAKAKEISDEESKLLTLRSDEAQAAADDARNNIIIGSVMLFAVVGFALLLLNKSLIAPLVRITQSMRSLATGDTTVDIPGIGRKDEVGHMADAVEVFRKNAIANRQLEDQATTARDETARTQAAHQKQAEQEAANLRFATQTLGEGLKRLAGGDVSFQLNEPFAAEYEPLRQDFNASLQQLGTTIGSVLTTVEGMENGTREIADGANDLSKRTEQQAAALEQTAAALDEITVNVSNSSKRTEEARSVAVTASHSAVHSSQVVNQAEDAMRRIEESSQQISNIIGVIDEIAFQTNLLALNAGVEAARAGEAGKGFAVVAQEVRELAQRSANAAKEIKGLIHNSSAEVDNGVRLVRETGVALKSIGDHVVQINQLMEAIATSAREQSTGLAEVNSAVNQMDQTTQQNAAMVEQSTAAAGALANEANRLKMLVSQFTLASRTSFNAGAAHPATAQSSHRPVASPARTLAAKIGKAFGAGGSAQVKQEWSEF
ncbi:methyl-accepting chemotaxis protein [Allorhizobium taibaishanense]|uniref:Chemotaxis protein n=1 Tax=Allorhizobium taibaishanense TaxID=887144 RepID=A0A1Q9AAD0_9HYPH|nr:methyl-accepting chemotaxis protein [Allorhizobium taibaishanense]MBB4007006.1 methyl-accepting chemotaxis protein [Allorhizobium taibaishanense]OLP51823.1 chemotaxis protein [Allorhizobium taibaishanense]